MARKYYSKKKEEPREDPVLYGVVYNCSLLNFRSGPSYSHSVISQLEPGTKLLIDTEISRTIDKDWLKVSTAQGVEGYCKKEFVKVDSGGSDE